MPTRDEWDAGMQQLQTAIGDAANRVSTDIQALRDRLASGAQITDADLANLQTRAQEVGNIDPAQVVPAPTPTQQKKS